MEIERKWMVTGWPEGLPLEEEFTMRQGYISVQPTVRIREEALTGGSTDYILCFKSGSGLAREEIERAARIANADSFIRRLPKGYDTMVTSDGANLSQGQRQLLAIARAAVADPPVLILDEATSSVDTRTEALIEKGMDRLMEGRTVFVIAHRLSTVRNANAIMVLEHGEIVERGDHDDLLAQKGLYYKLYNGMFELS